MTARQKSRILARGRHWMMVGIALLLFVLVAVFVDLEPQVRENFFFSPKDPEFQQTAKIGKLFPGGDQMIVNVAGPIDSPYYLEKIGELTREIEGLQGVTSVDSLSQGPKNLEDA